MKCPKCGYHRQVKDNAFVPGNECPSCGIVYGKHEKATHSNNKGSESSGPLQNPSPVSASSLRKARERVDRRLRKTRVAKVPDLRHIKTLEMARRLTAEGVRQRQAEWKEHNREKTAKTTPEETAAAHQKQSQSSGHSPVELAPKETPKRLTSAIAKALNKKERSPEQQPATATPIEQSVTPESLSANASPEIGTGTPADKTSSFVEDRVHTSARQPDTEAHLAPNEPIPLFQNKTDASMNDDTKPPSLKEMLKEYDPPKSERVMTFKPLDLFHKLDASGLMRLLPLVAWLILGAGVTGAILSWTTIGDVQAAMQTTAPTGNSTLPLGLLLGFAYLATGVLGFAFFWVSSLISHQLKDIRRLLLLHPTAQPDPKEAQRTYTA